ncbi:extracellular matrix protein 2 isoform X1 [Alosa sapidissima]|uniref:extracellular matrix protein 2 isoform X1 n=1 Tax=Alosa sapidissima TaxID=34773 RepID=UPI001C0A0979|nr:extracellular matrix protein 2 isoform X1 [Alosa sapidissima]XP_041952765.1 extracellular matrix protein 2 isoform X1 [Alosa sapidissima]
MYRVLVTCLCLWAAVTLTEAKPPRRKGGQQPKHGKDARDEPEYDDTPFLPERTSQCLVNGISLFEGAVWSPEPCNVCQCRAGAVSCRAVPCPRAAVQNDHQSGGQRAKKLPPHSENTVEAPPKKKEKEKSRPAGKSKKPNGKAATDSLPQREETAVTPVRVVEKPVAPPKRKPEASLRTAVAGGSLPMAWALEGNTDAKLDQSPPAKQNTQHAHAQRQPFDDDDDDDDYYDYLDDDDDDDSSMMRPARRLADLPTGRPVPIPTGRPVVPLTRRPGALPSRRPVALPTGRPVVRFNGRSTVPHVQRNSYMESLPAGCLLSDSLIACGSTGMGHLPIIKDTGVRTLYLADNKISKIPARALAGLPNLEWLDLSKNKLDDFSFSPGLFQNLTRLRRLNLDGNNLTKVPALPSSLMELKINDNKLMGLTPNTFKGLFKLLTLELEDNHFHDGNVSPLTFRPLRKLIYLRLDDNKFRAVPSGLPTSLQELHLSDNRIEVVQAGVLNKTINLRVLNLSHNKLREDRIAPRAWIHLSKLDTLDLSHNKLVHVPSFLPVALRQLTLHHNHIERIPGYVFAHMRPGLDSLHLSYNRLREDGVGEVSFLGLYNSLTELLLDHNRLGSVPRGILQLKALQQLRLNNNFISYVPLNAICDTRVTEDSPLMSVHLENNLIDRRLIPPTAFSCIKSYHSVVLRPQNYEDIYE